MRANVHSQTLAVNGDSLLASFNRRFPACSFCGVYIENQEKLVRQDSWWWMGGEMEQWSEQGVCLCAASSLCLLATRKGQQWSPGNCVWSWICWILASVHWKLWWQSWNISASWFLYHVALCPEAGSSLGCLLSRCVPGAMVGAALSEQVGQSQWWEQVG